MKTILTAALLLLVGACAMSQDKDGVFFVEPKDGATVGQAFKVVMGVRGKTIAPAGTMTENTGHHHLLIDTDPVKAGDVVPVDDRHVHFGKGQTEAMVKLPPGDHTLQLQFADGAHRSFGPAMSSAIHIVVR
jgi:hypothetical protein